MPLRLPVDCFVTPSNALQLQVCNLAVPFFFKGVVDFLSGAAAATPFGLGASALVIAYGASRLTTSLLGELRGAIFATVSTTALRKISTQVCAGVGPDTLAQSVMATTGPVPGGDPIGGQGVCPRSGRAVVVLGLGSGGRACAVFVCVLGGAGQWRSSCTSLCVVVEGCQCLEIPRKLGDPGFHFREGGFLPEGSINPPPPPGLEPPPSRQTPGALPLERPPSEKVSSVSRLFIYFFGVSRLFFFFWRKSRVEKKN